MNPFTVFYLVYVTLSAVVLSARWTISIARRAARRIHTTFALCARDRAHLERALLRRLWPLT
jgi:hypothetical protein